MSTTAILTVVIGLLAIVGVPMAIGFFLEKRSRARWEAIDKVRAERARTAVARRKSPQPVPAVKKNRIATPVGARR